MSQAWWANWQSRWRMVAEDLIAREVGKIERFGQELDDEWLLWKFALDFELETLWQQAWEEAEEEDRRLRAALAAEDAM